MREPTKFEQAYHEYNRQLSEALQQPFPKDFYFKKGSAAEKRFEEDQVASPQGFSAIAAAAGKGKDAKKGKDAATTEVKSTRSADGEAENRPLPRTTEADAKNDVRSLERKLDRTLYLVVKSKGGKGWKFPAKALADTKHENLHDVSYIHHHFTHADGQAHTDNHTILYCSTIESHRSHQSQSPKP